MLLKRPKVATYRVGFSRVVKRTDCVCHNSNRVVSSEVARLNHPSGEEKSNYSENHWE